MWSINLRLGIAEIIALTSLALVAALIVVAIVAWPVAIIPATTYALGMSVAYGMYRRYSGESAHLAAHARTEPVRHITFRVADVRGACPLGRRAGDFIRLSNGSIEPELCPEAAAVLRMAVRDGRVKQWCCPVYDHMLVFEREPIAA